MNEKLAIENTNLQSWQWPEDRRAGWKVATPEWQSFSKKWRVDSNSSIDRNLSVLDFAPLTSEQLGIHLLEVIYVRESYVNMFERIWSRALTPPGTKGGVLVTGQPGTGKRLFLCYLLVRLLQKKQNILFSTDGEELFLFFHDCVFMARADAGNSLKLPTKTKPPPCDKFIWSLFDIAEETGTRWLLISSPCFSVQTASPNPVRYKILVKKVNPMICGLPLWSHQELAKGLQFQDFYQPLLDQLQDVYGDTEDPKDPITSLDGFAGAGAILQERYPRTEGKSTPSPEDALDTLLDAAIERFGYAARDVFQAISQFDNCTRSHENAFSVSYEGLRHVIAVLLSGIGVPDSEAHRIITTQPVFCGNLTSDRWKLTFKSGWVSKSMSKQLRAAEDSEIREKINHFRKIPATSPLAGCYFEPLAHRELMAPTSMGGSWPLIVMAPHSDTSESGSRLVVADPSTPLPEGVRFAKTTRNVVKFYDIPDIPLQFQNNCYYVPELTTFPLFDAFTVEFDTLKKTGTVWILQITTSRSHGGSAAGYRAIRKIVSNLKDQLQEVPPPRKTTKTGAMQAASMPHVGVRYLLIAPRAKGDPAPPMKWKFPKGWDKDCQRHDHRGEAYWLEIILTV